MSLRSTLLGLAALAVLGRTALGEEPVGPSVSLLDAVRATLGLKAEIKLRQEEVLSQQGQVQTARGQFDLSLFATLGHRLDTLPLTAAMQLQSTAPGATSLATQTTSYTLGLSQQLRFGTTFVPHVEVSRAAQSGVDPANGRARVSFTVIQPLFRGRGASAVAATEQAAKQEEEARHLRLRHSLAERVAVTEQAYWAWRVARDTVAILREAERRAQQLLAEELSLIEAKEQPPADSKQFEANLADVEAARLEAERVDIEARQALGVQMGIAWTAMGGLVDPTTELPTVAEEEIPAGDRLLALARESAGRRNDVLAASAQVRAAQILVVAARRNLEPQLDLAVDVGYAGLSEGNGAGPFVTPLGDRISGVNAGANLSLAYPLQNNAARGLVQQRSAELRQAIIVRDELERVVAADVVVAGEALGAAARAQRSADRAALTYREAVANEQKKLRAGLSTNIDVILTQTRLTNAELAAIRARARLAEVLTRLRFSTGTLVDTNGDAGSVSIEALTTPPL